jgi:hypothetical protein
MPLVEGGLKMVLALKREGLKDELGDREALGDDEIL